MLYCILYSAEQAMRRILLGTCTSSAHPMVWLRDDRWLPYPDCSAFWTSQIPVRWLLE